MRSFSFVCACVYMFSECAYKWGLEVEVGSCSSLSIQLFETESFTEPGLTNQPQLQA